MVNSTLPDQGTGPSNSVKKPAQSFFPSGAIAFFIALVLLCLIIWFGIYFLMIERI